MKLSKLDLTNHIYLNTEYQEYLSLTDETSFDSFHNSFFESHWSKYTHLKEVELNLIISGEGVIQILRKVINSESLISSLIYDCKSLTKKSIKIDIKDYSSSRIYFKIIPKTNSRLQNRCFWSTSQKPNKDISLAVIMCTFNKQEYITKNLDKLHKCEDFQNSPIETFIIDNASNLTIKTHTKLHYFAQDNYGGAGGFTRGLIEARKLNRFTHYQFMDDDILLDPDMILRAFAFMSYTKKDYAFSGAMLCMDRPNVIWESGADFTSSPKNLSPSSHFWEKELNISLLDKMSTPHAFEYGAWWFNMFSEDSVKLVGLPLPIFIRGDDIEYGVRLSKKGIQTINLPGVGVWHDTFYSKISFWLSYYSIRNLSLVSLIHFNLAKSYITLFKTFKMAFSDLIFYQYYKVETITDGIQTILFKINQIQEHSTPKSQKKLIERYKDFQEQIVEGYKETSATRNSLIHVIIKLLTLNGHILIGFPKNEVVLDSQGWKKELLKVKRFRTLSPIFISHKTLDKTFKYDMKRPTFFKLLLRLIFSFSLLAIGLPFYKFLSRRWFQRVTKIKAWESHLEIS